MSFFTSPVAKRTRLQWQIQGFNETSCGSSKDQSRKRNREVVDLDDYWNNKRVSEPKTHNESGISSRPNERLKKSNRIDETSTDESKDEESDKEDSSYVLLEESNEMQEIDYTRFEKSASTNKGCDSATPSNSRTPTYSDFLSDDSDSTDSAASFEEDEEIDKDYQIFFKFLLESENETKTDLSQSPADVPLSCSESDSDSLDGSDLTLPYKRPNLPANRKQSSMEYTKETDLSTSVDSKEKNHSVMQKTYVKKVDEKSMGESSDVDTHGKRNAKYIKVDQDDTVKHKKSKKGRQASRKGYGDTVDAILNSIISNEVVHEKECDDDSLPLKFRFDDSEDESCSQITDESSEEGLFQEMDFVLECEEIGSYETPKNQEKDDFIDNMDICKRGELGHDIYLEEQVGYRCRLCGAVLLESRFVIPKLANYAPDRSKRSYHFDEQFSSLENPYFQSSDLNPPDFLEKTKGTVWELIPTTILQHLYPHQQQGFEFLWKNLAGTIDLSRLHKLGPRGGGGGGGCIISHAPGTGKTLLTILLIESFLKIFPQCCPVIVAPASMLLTWESEFEKWKFGLLFDNLNSLDISAEEKMNGGSRPNKDLIRAVKISRWSNGRSVLGVSYNLYEILAGNSNMKNINHEKMGNILLERPNLVVLDEGHTPRNQDSNIWNTLLKLKTKNRVILSGTPFQNNLKELSNTLRLVRPATASSIVKDKVFADMIQPKNREIAKSRSTPEDIEKLKVIISPFVHIHKGHILQSKLPGLKQSVILLNPHPFQKPLIEMLGNLAKTLEYEHKLALVSLHPSLILNCSISEKEEKSLNKRELKKVRLQPEVGVKTRFVIELIRLSVLLREKVLIFSQYIEPLHLLKDQIALAFAWDVGREVKVIKGKIRQKARQTIIDDFNDPHSKMKVLLASTKCCSEGINLIGASRVVLLDVVWNPSVERQAISRAYRLGQKKMVYTYHLMAAGTTEEEKYDRQVEKERLAEMVFSSASMAGGELKKVNVDDNILQQLVDHKELKDMFKEVRYPENQTRI